MTMTLPEDKKDFVKKEVKAVSEKLVVVEKFHEKVSKIESFVSKLNEFDKSLKTIDKWMMEAEGQLHDIKNKSDKMTPEDRVSYTMDSKKMLPPRSQSSRVTLLPNRNFFHKVTRSHRMLKITRMS